MFFLLNPIFWGDDTLTLKRDAILHNYTMLAIFSRKLASCIYIPMAGAVMRRFGSPGNEVTTEVALKGQIDWMLP